MGRSGDQLSQRRQLFFLDQMSLQPLQVFIALTRLVEQADQLLVEQELLEEDK